MLTVQFRGCEMGGVEDSTQGCRDLSAQDRVTDSTKPKKCKENKCMPRKKISKVKRTRVNIGLAFNRWRALKATKGMKSDAQLALYLLDKRVKKMASMPTSSAASNKTKKFSQSEVQTLISEEVHSAMRKNESRLTDLIETIEKQVHGFDLESSIQTLEAQINMVMKRAEAALTHLTTTQTKSLNPSLALTDIGGIESEGRTRETTSQVNKKSQDKTIDKKEELFQMMETTKMSLKRMRADNDALMAAVADLREKPSLPVPTESEGHVSVKGEPEDEQNDEINSEEPKKLKKPKTETVDAECLSSAKGHTPMHTVSKQDKLSYPPLPPTVSPATLKTEAALYNIPQRLEVHLALIREPPGLSVLWKLEKEDPSAPPMNSYSIYMATEKVKGSSIFPNWIMLGEVTAIKLPMCVMVSKYKPGHKVCVAVVGKDIFDRYGPYSQVVTAVIPD